MAALPLARHDWHGGWNYALRPEAYPHLPHAPQTAQSHHAVTIAAMDGRIDGVGVIIPK